MTGGEMDQLLRQLNAMHDAIQAYDDSVVTKEVEDAADELRNAASTLHESLVHLIALGALEVR